jgi:hypothetical protein
MPPELKQVKNWVLWVPIWTGSKWTKRPIQISGYGASTKNSKHWASFDDVKHAYEGALQRGYIEAHDKNKPPQRVQIGGVGFVFDGQPDKDGLVLAGVDFDKVFTGGEIASLAQERIKRLGSYTEWSVSGVGLHVIVKARPLQSGVAHHGVEIYTSGRFFTMTGHAPENALLVAAPDKFAALAEELRAQNTSSRAGEAAPSPGDGVQTADAEANAWFGKLLPEKQSEVVRYAALHIANNSKLFELTKDGGNYQEYLKLTFAIARSGVAGAEDIFVEAASISKKADAEEALRKFFQNCERAKPSTNDVTIGTLLHAARQCGANFDHWKRQLPGVPPLPPGKRKPLHGGEYSPNEALELINSHYLIGKSDQEVAIFRIRDDGLLAFTPLEQFKLDVANIFVRVSAGSAKHIPVEKFWREDPRRHQRKIVFKPGGTTEPDEFNLWRGFGVQPRKGWQKQRRLLRHILKVICRRDKAKFKYLMRWLAWAAQNPDEHPGTIIVLKSRRQGTGKSTLGVVMLTIFGQHGALIDDSDRLLGQFNDWVEPVSFILAEEILWAGDHKTADKLKSRVTAGTFQIERKNGAIRQIQNRLHLMMTTNHDHAVAAGVGDRRLVVYDVSDEYACDKGWFDPLYRDLDDGGTSEFLYFLQYLRLGDWHPRQILKTAETAEQQRMSGDSVSQWAQACIYADAINGFDLGLRISLETLRGAYTVYCKQHSLHAGNVEIFGKACTDMFGPRKRLPAVPGSKQRPWGYDVPTGDQWQAKIDTRLGIQNSALTGLTKTSSPVAAATTAPPVAAAKNTSPSAAVKTTPLSGGVKTAPPAAVAKTASPAAVAKSAPPAAVAKSAPPAAAVTRTPPATAVKTAPPSAAPNTASLCFDPAMFPKRSIPPEGFESLGDGVSDYGE